MEVEFFTFKDIVNILKRRAIFIIVVTVISTGIGYGISTMVIKDSYLTCCKLFVGVDLEAADAKGSLYFQSMYSFQEFVKSYLGILTSYDVIEECIKGSEVDSDPGTILHSLTAKLEDDQEVIDLSIITSEPYEGEKILRCIAEKFNDISKKYITLGKVDLVSRPLTSKVDTKVKKIIFLAGGFVAGLLISITISFILFYFDDSIKTEEEVYKIFNCKVIVEIPRLKNL